MPAPSPAKAQNHPSAAAVAHAVTQPVQAAEEAFLQGDFCRARTLLAAVLADPRGLPAALRQQLAARHAALGFDPFALQVGLGTLVVYAVAWGWALSQH